MKKKLQKVFALLLTFSMLMSMMSITAFATVGDNSQQIENWGGTKYYDANGKVVDGAQSLAGDAVVGLTKSIESTDTENYFDITLTVETEQKIEEIKNAPAGGVVQQASPAEELKKYKELLDMGVVTQEEFEAKKKQILGL